MTKNIIATPKKTVPVRWGMSGLQQAAIILTLSSALLVACNKSEKTPTTKERLGSVKELQETQTDFYLPHKSVDYLAEIKNQRESAAKAQAAEPSSRPAPPETRVAAAPAPVAPVVTPAVTPTPVITTPAPTTAPTTTIVTPPPAAPVVVAAAPKAVEQPAREVVRVAPARDPNVACRQPEYPATSKRLEESGTVTLRLFIDVNGNVSNTEVQASSGFARLDDAARSALSRCKYRPGTVDGRPEPSITLARFTWKL